MYCKMKPKHLKVFFVLTLSLRGEGPIGLSLTNMQIALKVLKVSYRQKLGVPHAGS